MNADLLNVMRQIVATEEESILSNARRVSAFLSDLAQDVPKPQKAAFVKCLEYKSAMVLKDAPQPERINIKKKLAQRINEEEGLDLKLCEETLALLMALLFGVDEQEIEDEIRAKTEAEALAQARQEAEAEVRAKAEAEARAKVAAEAVERANTSGHPLSSVAYPPGGSSPASREARYKEAKVLYDGEQYVKAFPLLEALANEGYAKAQLHFGYCYNKGQGVAQDNAKAVEWWRKAAGQGDAEAQANLGVCFHVGLGVVQDVAKAVEWWRKAAEQGVTDSQYNLGVCLSQGYKSKSRIGFSHSEAEKWLLKAAEQGDVDAQAFLFSLYWLIYPGKADAWRLKAAEQGYDLKERRFERLKKTIIKTGVNVTWTKAEEEAREEAKRKRKLQEKEWESQGLCYKCGGEFSFFSRRCKSCGRKKGEKDFEDMDIFH